MVLVRSIVIASIVFIVVVAGCFNKEAAIHEDKQTKLATDTNARKDRADPSLMLAKHLEGYIGKSVDDIDEKVRELHGDTKLSVIHEPPTRVCGVSVYYKHGCVDMYIDANDVALRSARDKSDVSVSELRKSVVTGIHIMTMNTSYQFGPGIPIQYRD